MKWNKKMGSKRPCFLIDFRISSKHSKPVIPSFYLFLGTNHGTTCLLLFDHLSSERHPHWEAERGIFDVPFLRLWLDNLFIFNRKVCVADFGPLNRAFWAWNYKKNCTVIFRKWWEGGPFQPFPKVHPSHIGDYPYHFQDLATILNSKNVFCFPDTEN